MAAIFNPRFLRILLWGAVTVIGLATLFLAWPRSYEVSHFRERIGTRYWDLPTGSRIGYTKIEGQASLAKRPVIYLHGGPGGMVSDKVIESLSPLAKAGFDLYVYDQIGSGHSARLEDISAYTVSRHKRDLEAIVAKIGAEKVILIGHSWGSMLATQYVQDNPESVEKMILSGPGPILPIRRSLRHKKPPDSLQLIAPEQSNREGNNSVDNWRTRLIDKWAYLFHRKLATDKEVDDFFTLLNTELSKSTHCRARDAEKYTGGSGYYAHIMTVRSFRASVDKRDMLAELATPVLLIRGQCDNQPWGYTEEYLKLLKHSRLEIVEGSGHDLLSGSSDKYLELIEAFLE